MYSGSTAVLVDVDIETWTIDVGEIETISYTHSGPPETGGNPEARLLLEKKNNSQLDSSRHSVSLTDLVPYSQVIITVNPTRIEDHISHH